MNEKTESESDRIAEEWRTHLLERVQSWFDELARIGGVIQEGGMKPHTTETKMAMAACRRKIKTAANDLSKLNGSLAAVREELSKKGSLQDSPTAVKTAGSLGRR